jgi:uncharacterized Ntn-hydrolase superfamily protein
MPLNRPDRFPLAHTYSIVARDPQTGAMGVAVQSHWFSVGSVVAWGEAGVGVVATQALVEPSYGPLGLQLMRAGKTARQSLQALLAGDDHPEIRQVAMLDHNGVVATHTGERCIRAAGHAAGAQFSAQANMMLKDTVWPAMAEAFKNSSGELAERLLLALEAAQSEGGDIRGQQSAALLVVGAQSTGRTWEDTLVSLRIEDHPSPLVELRRLLKVHNAYRFMNQGDAFLGEGKTEEALNAYRSAAALAPDVLEMPFWHGVTLLELGRIDDAVAIFQPIFTAEPEWSDLLQRLPAAGMLSVAPETLAAALSRSSQPPARD